MKNFILGSIVTFSLMFIFFESREIKTSIVNFAKKTKTQITTVIKKELNHAKKIQENSPLVIMGGAGRPIFIPKNIITNQKKESKQSVAKNEKHKKDIKENNQITVVSE